MARLPDRQSETENRKRVPDLGALSSGTGNDLGKQIPRQPIRSRMEIPDNSAITIQEIHPRATFTRRTDFA